MINGSCAEEIKGMISYPCCPKHKVMAYVLKGEDENGKISYSYQSKS